MFSDPFRSEAASLLTLPRPGAVARLLTRRAARLAPAVLGPGERVRVTAPVRHGGRAWLLVVTDDALRLVRPGPRGAPAVVAHRLAGVVRLGYATGWVRGELRVTPGGDPDAPPRVLRVPNPVVVPLAGRIAPLVRAARARRRGNLTRRGAAADRARGASGCAPAGGVAQSSASPRSARARQLSFGVS